MEQTRIIIYPKDVQRITGRTERWGRNFLKKIKASRLKSDQQFVSIQEFAEFTGLSVDLIRQQLVD